MGQAGCPGLALKLGALIAGDAGAPDQPHRLVIALRGLLGEDGELVRIDLVRGVVKGAHSHDLVEMIVEPGLHHRRVVAGQRR